MVSKMLLFITLVTCLIVPAISRYHGDSCNDRSRAGICTPLSECTPLLEEINAAGSPMPMHMRHRLHEVGCGFTTDEPLVCCNLNQEFRPPITNKPTTNDIDVYTNLKPTDESTGSLTDNSNSINSDRRDIDGPQDVSNHPNIRLLPKDCGTIDSNRILGGNRTQLYEMPWMVILTYDEDGVNKIGCGGTLINKRYVLTAAHCVQVGTRRTLTGVILGEYDLRTDPDCEVIAGNKSCAPRVVNATIEEVISHPGYKRATLFDDIALIRLAEPADFRKDTIAPICLPVTRQLQQDNLDGLFGMVAGWGIAEDNIPAPVLMSVGLPIIPNVECQAAYGGTTRIYNRQLCAGGVKNKDSCGGDSGGPLMYPGLLGSGGVRYVQRGIVSFGPKKCGVGGLPGVYTRTPYYMKWILDNIRG